MQDSIFDEIKKLAPQELENVGVIKVARTRANGYPTYECSFCGNGQGENGDGLTVQEYSWGFNYHCFKEGKNYTAVDLIAAHCGYSSRELGKVAKWAKEKFNLNYVVEEKKIATPKSEPDKKFHIPRDYSEFYKKSQKRLEKYLATNGKFRGLEKEELKNAGLATVEELREVGERVPCEVIIFPFNENHFFMRSVADTPLVKRGNTGGKKELYIPEGINCEMPVFVTEGIIDCLSFIKAGVPAMAVDGAGNFKNLAEWLDRKGFKDAEMKPRLIVVGDNNDDGTGQRQATEGVRELVREGYAAVNVILSPNEKYDANEFLQKDFEKFVSRVYEIYVEVENELDKISAEIREQKLLEESGGFISAENYDKVFFEKELAELKNVAHRKSGYKNLDEKQEFLPGLYVIGAIASLGKTTFCLQWAEQMARLGETVLFCSYEMSLLELHSKMLARNIYLKNQRTTLTATQIRRGGNDSDLKSVRSDFNLENFKIAKCKFETIDELIEKLEMATEKLEKPPVIFIDYLQFIRPSEKLRETSAKAAIDDIVMKLKIFQQEKNALIVVVSSFNRMNYTQTAAFESFKESGGVEYTADVLLALELYCTAELKGNQLGAQNDRKIIDEAKKEYPRKVRLKCLKNRVGGLYECFFKFFMKNDYFEACTEEDLKVGQPKMAHRS